ncbi:MAG: glutamate racemase [Candidatus Eisenbacteria bacterium RBG_16_71_46]|nr:MAG: glutamate racemase [Candidatus Eisenbacteria bacterium RBG_16_71_46]OGF24027.1 MAG: glutamate racemase [Candidatus Eisenbacteria bacterium RBG_19FT_COMBO_70_11]
MPATHDPRPIGVFDSGIGGLTAVHELFRVLPSESIVYFGDTARLPYGSKSKETVTRFSLEIATFLVRRNIKCLVVACNTSSSHALDALQRRFEIPVIGVIEPSVRAALASSPGGRIGVVGTLATVGSGAYPAAIEKRLPGANVIARACPLFVPLVEEGWLDHPVTRMVAEEYLVELRNGHLESLILGCTHYPLIAPLIAEIMGPVVRLIDSGAEAARATAELLAERGQLAAGPPSHHVYLSDEPRRRSFSRIARAFLGRELPPVTVVDQTDLPWFERPHAVSDLDSAERPA